MIKGRPMDHIGVAVTDVEATAKWYQDVLGFEVFGKFLVPVRRQVLDGKTSVNQFLLDFVAQHYVQRIGQFVGFGAHKTTFRAVDIGDKLIKRYTGKLLRKSLLQFAVMRLPESLTAPDYVFVKARLTLVHAKACTAAAQRAVKASVTLLLIGGVSRFVNCRKNRMGIFLG